MTQVIDAADGSVAAGYHYDPFGNVISQTGALTGSNPFRFSTKYFDDETGLYYYGYRYYSPELGRWINRDPIGEEGGLNVYGFVGNDGVNNFDLYGLLQNGEYILSISVKRKEIKWVTLMQKTIGKKNAGGDTYGHWWLEIDGQESYGWWPKEQVRLLKTFTSVPGELNGTTMFGGTPTKDPHHGDVAESAFNPKVDFGGYFGISQDRTLKFGKGKGKKCKCVDEDEIKDSLRSFAKAYSGSWSYPFGQNCHSFQKNALEASCLEE